MPQKSSLDAGGGPSRLEKELCENELIILAPEGDKVLLGKNNGVLHLPCFRSKLGYQFNFEYTKEWIPDAKKQFGIEFGMILAQCIWHREVKVFRNGHLYQAVLVVRANGEGASAPPGTQWVSVGSALICHADHGAQKAIEQFLLECQEKVQPNFRPLFARPNWFDSALKWVEQKLAQKEGFEGVQEFRQLKCTYRGTVFEAKTNLGSFFLKASPHFVNEAAITELLARILPEYVETPVATDAGEGLLLMDDYGEILVPMQFEKGEEKPWIGKLVQMHLSTIDKVEVLQKVGLKILSLECLESHLQDLIGHSQIADIVEGAVLEALKKVSRAIIRDCRTLREVNIPLTLVHGDLILSNLYRPCGKEGQYRLLDWAEACISHPFFDIWCCRNRDVYFETYIKYLSDMGCPTDQIPSKDILEKSYKVSQNLEPLQRAVRLLLEIRQLEPCILPEMRIQLNITLKKLVRIYSKSKDRKRAKKLSAS